MRKMLATALLALTVAASAIAPVSSVALASMDQPVEQFVVDSQSLSNIEHTQDNQQSTETTPAPPDDCTCMVLPEEAPAA